MVAPLAVKLAEPPAHTDADVTDTAGGEFTVTIVVAVHVLVPLTSVAV